MLEIKEKKNCCGCRACQNICPKGCISMQFDEEGFAYPVVNKEECIGCGLCQKVCPVLAKLSGKASEEKEVKAYAAFNLNTEARLKSSSGGIFSLLAEFVLEKGGVVFGVGFDENFVVRHLAVEKVEDLEKLRTSKYVQSDTGSTFSLAKKFLDEGRLVLFSGTPCQISGLKSFLGKERENLLTQDIVCHGVPSPVAWGKYVQFWQEKTGKKLTRAFFRDKQKSMRKTMFTLAFEGGEAYQKPYKKDQFVAAFLKNEALRPTCYDCPFKGKNRASDITIADFWGAGFVCPSMNSAKGTSLVIVNSEKGEEVFAALKGKMKVKPVSLSRALKFNHNYFSSARK